MLLRASLLPLIVGLSLSLGICCGSRPAMRSLWTNIEEQINTLAALNVDIKEARTTLPPIEANDVERDAAGDLRGAVHGAVGRRAEQSSLDRRRAACLEAVVRVKDLIDRVSRHARTESNDCPNPRRPWCTAPGFLDTRLRYAAWRSSYCSRASSGVRYASFSRRQHWL